MAPIHFEPVIPKSLFWPVAGAGVLMFFVLHPWVGYLLWAAAVAILFQELLCLALLPALAVWRAVSGRKQAQVPAAPVVPIKVLIANPRPLRRRS